MNKKDRVGPGIVAGSSGNDSGGITTYSIIGSSLGYKLLWLMMISIPMLVVVSDMCARTSSVAKKGLGSLIRERYGAKIALIMITGLFIVNIAVTAANVAGMAVAIELLTGIQFRILIIPLAILIWFIVTRGTYRKVEKILIILSLGLLSYIITAFIVNPSWQNVFINTFIPHIELNFQYILLAVGLLGATVSPYIYFYFSSAEVEKRREGIKETLFDARVGAFWCGIVAYFIILTAAAVLFTAGITNIQTAKDAALALKPLAGDFAFILFAIGLFSASMIAAAVLPLSTSYAVSETLGVESGIDKKIKEAPVFYWIFLISLGIGAFIMLLGFDPISIMFLSMVISGILTPFMVFFLIKICNDSEIMGEHKNKRIVNIIAWITVFITALFVVLLFSGLLFKII